MKNKKLFLFTTDYPPSQGGGIGIHAEFISKTLKSKGFQIVVLSEYYINSSAEAIANYKKKNDIEILKMPAAPTMFKLLQKIILSLKMGFSKRPDIIIGTGKHSVWFASLLSFFLRIPLITIGHGSEFTETTSKYDKILNRLAFGGSDLLISVSHFTKNIIFKENIKPKKIVVIHNPVDSKKVFKLKDNSYLDFIEKNDLKEKKILLTVGAMSKRKGQHQVIEALKNVTKNISNIVYVIIGLPNDIERLKELAKKNNVSKNVEFKGVVSTKELNLWYNSCHVFCMTSTNNKGDFEGFGIAVKEAALCKKPSIVSDSSGLEEAVINNLTGLVFQQNNIKELEHCITDLITNDKKRNKFGLSAFENAVNNNSENIIGEKYYSQIKNVLKKK